MPTPRDPRSVEWDARVAVVLRRAIRARQTYPYAYKYFVASPTREFRHLDRGGMTATERGFIRSVYYHTWRQPINDGVPVTWSVKLRWGRIERRSGGRWGREVKIRMFRYGYGKRHAERKVSASERWSVPGQLAAAQSLPGQRIDQVS